MSATRARRRRSSRGCGHGRRPRPRPWVGVSRFCHLINIIMGVSLLYGGGELIASVTVSSALRLLGFSAAFLPSRRSHKSVVLCQSTVLASLPRETTSQQPFGFPHPVPLRARRSGRAGASRTLVRLRTLHGVCGD